MRLAPEARFSPSPRLKLMTPTEHDVLIEQLVQSAHDVGAERLNSSTSGNFSLRLDDKTIAITAARTRLGRLCAAEVLALPLNGPLPDFGALSPSRETPMHLAMYRSHPEVHCFLHFQSLAATTLGCRAAPLPDLNFIPELPVYVRSVGSVPYFPPGSDDLAVAVAKAFDDPNVRVAHLRNHGQVVIGNTPAQAVERATFFELACRIYLLSEQTGGSRPYSNEEVALLMSY